MPTVVVHPRHPASRYRCSFTVVGTFQVLIGLICAILGVVLIIQFGTSQNSSSGIGTGILYTITGILALSAGNSPSQCNVIAGMVFAILSAISAAANIALGIMALELLAHYSRQSSRYRVNESAYAIIITVIVVCVFEFIFSIAHTIISCCGSCCASDLQTTPSTHPGMVSAPPAYGQTNISEVRK
uniref:uncharacterized protein LOC120336213 n=1 Tax=Styela clava TaxID=7725 RepID=UPI00193A20ED|nr:uncharacterized protein LOC120336213 [Styela clava]